jgi:hypothetical protein
VLLGELGWKKRFPAAAPVGVNFIGIPDEE